MHDTARPREPWLATLHGAGVRRITTFLVTLACSWLAASPSAAQAVAHLAWDPPAASGGVSYVVEWGPAPGVYRASAAVPAGTTTYKARGLRPGVRYYFVVRALDAAGRQSGPSNEVSVVAGGPLETGTEADVPPSWPDETLSVEVSGTGQGTIAGAPGQPDCQAACRFALLRDTPVTLAASPAPGSRFVGWRGIDCPGTSTCAFVLDQPRTVAAVFEPDTSLAAPGASSRYLAEGAASDFFETRITLSNPGGRTASAAVEFLRGDGVVVPYAAQVPALGSASVDADDVPGLRGQAFSTVVNSDVPLAVDRTMSWRDGWGGISGAHAETAVPRPARRWYLAEGSTQAGFELFYLLENPGSQPVTAHIRYLRPTGSPLDKHYHLPARSRTSVWVDHEAFAGIAGEPLAGTAVSAVIDVLDDAGIIVERAMYGSVRGRFEAGHASAGVTTPAERWYFAEGATGPYFDMFLLLANPGPRTADVVVTYLLPDGRQERRHHAVGPWQRYTIWVDQEGGPLGDAAVSSVVESTNGVPIVAERSMWWPGDSRTWVEAHNSSGATESGTRWAVGDGDASAPATGRATYLLVANPSEQAARIRITLLFRAGTPPVSREFTVPASTRFGLSAGDAFPEAVGERFGALVESLGEQPTPIIVERAMYADGPGRPWARGTNVVATRLE